QEFLTRLPQLGWAVGLAPLVSMPFHDCKSAIKFLEYTAAGIPTIASPAPAYRIVEHGRNAVLASTTEDWARAILQLLDDPALSASLVRQARLDCSSRFSFAAAEARLSRLISSRLSAH